MNVGCRVSIQDWGEHCHVVLVGQIHAARQHLGKVEEGAEVWILLIITTCAHDHGHIRHRKGGILRIAKVLHGGGTRNQIRVELAS